jgi:hypothetical protein
LWRILSLSLSLSLCRLWSVPFFCLAYSAPAISSRSHKSSLQSPSSDSTSKNPWKSYSNGDRSTTPEFDDNASLVGAAPLLKSFVTQVSNWLQVYWLLTSILAYTSEQSLRSV